MRTKSAEDLNFLNRERRLGSSGSRATSSSAGRPRRNSHRSSTEALMRSLADMETESSVDPDNITMSQASPSKANRPQPMPQTSPPKVNRQSSQRSVSSIDVSGLKVSSVDVTPQHPRQASPGSDTSDMDSYSDIMTQQTRDKGPIKGRGLVLRKTHSSSSSESSTGKPEDGTSKTPGSISQLYTQQNEHNNTAKRGQLVKGEGNFKTSTPNLHSQEPRRLPSSNHTPMKYRSEGNLSSYYNPISSPPSNGLLTTLNGHTVLTNGDVQREASLPNGGPSSHRPTLRRLFGSQDKIKINGVAKPNSDRDVKPNDDEVFHSQKSYASSLRNVSGSNEYLYTAQPTVPSKITYTDRTRKPKAQHLSVHIPTDSNSSQSNSVESLSNRQIAAEHAAAALMQSHQRNQGSQSSLTRENLAMKDFRDKSTSHVKLKHDHIANLAHLHSSSCW